MKTVEEIKDKIAKVTKDNTHVLDCYPATVDINAPRALMQLAAVASLRELYWAIGVERPRFKCDDYTKKNF